MNWLHSPHQPTRVSLIEQARFAMLVQAPEALCELTVGKEEFSPNVVRSYGSNQAPEVSNRRCRVKPVLYDEAR